MDRYTTWRKMILLSNVGLTCITITKKTQSNTVISLFTGRDKTCLKGANATLLQENHYNIITVLRRLQSCAHIYSNRCKDLYGSNNLTYYSRPTKILNQRPIHTFVKQKYVMISPTVKLIAWNTIQFADNSHITSGLFRFVQGKSTIHAYVYSLSSQIHFKSNRKCA